MCSCDDAGETRAYNVHFFLRWLGDGRGLSAGAHPVFRTGRMERQSVVESECFVLFSLFHT